MTAVAPGLLAVFEQRYGAPPSGVWAAPGRVNLIGEHTDYNDGFVLPVALEQDVLVAARPRAGRTLRCRSVQADGEVEVPLDGLAPGSVEGWAAYVAGVAWALEGRGYRLSGADLLVDGRVPLGAGLSSSAALECAAALALCGLSGHEPERWELVLAAQQAENGFVGVPTGIMDQAASMLCVARHALFLDVRDRDVEHVPLDLAAAGLTLLVVDTRAPHRLVDSEYAERRQTCHEAARALGVPALREVPAERLEEALARLGDDRTARRVRHVVTENQRVLDTVALLRQGRLTDLGPLLTASHRSLQHDYEVTVPQLDVAVDTLLSSGALGARMTGGGFGGCVIALLPADLAGDAAEAVRARFAAEGFEPPAHFATTPSDGARRVV